MQYIANDEVTHNKYVIGFNQLKVIFDICMSNQFIPCLRRYSAFHYRNTFLSNRFLNI